MSCPHGVSELLALGYRKDWTFQSHVQEPELAYTNSLGEDHQLVECASD